MPAESTVNASTACTEQGVSALTGAGMLGRRLPEPGPESPGASGSAVADCVGQTCGAPVLREVSRPAPSPGPALPWEPVLRPAVDTELLALCTPPAMRLGSCRLTWGGTGRQGSAGQGLR